MPQYNKADLERRMAGAIEALKGDLTGLRTGRANVQLLDPVMVTVYGANMPLNQVAAISVPEPRLITVNVWDKGMVAAVDKAIRAAGLGLNPVVDGQTLRVPIPPLTEERRKDLTKIVRNAGEDAKVAVRNLRRDANEQAKKLLKDKEIGEDEERRSLDDVQKLTDRVIAEIDKLVASKEAEVLAV